MQSLFKVVREFNSGEFNSGEFNAGDEVEKFYQKLEIRDFRIRQLESEKKQMQFDSQFIGPFL